MHTQQHSDLEDGRLLAEAHPGLALANVERPQFASAEFAIVKIERPATVAGHSLADLPTYVRQCEQMDGEIVGLYFEQNWKHMAGNVYGMAYLAKEMKRKFSLLDRKKQVDGTYKTIRGFTSFEQWFKHATGKSVRMAYYVLETEEQKHKRNANRRANTSKSAVQSEVEEEPTLPEPQQSFPTITSVRSADWTDDEYVKTCVRFVESTLKPLESDPQRFHRVARAIVAEILGDMGTADLLEARG